MNDIAMSPNSGNVPRGVEIALYAASLGWRVFPLTESNVPFARDAIAAALGVDPSGHSGVYLATTNAAEIRALWTGNRVNARIGLAMGNGRMAIDCDEKNGKSGSATMRANGWAIPLTACQRTQSGGAHYIVKIPPGTIAPTDQGSHGLGNGLDRRGDNGGYIAFYDPAMLTMGIADAPAWSLTNVNPRAGERRSPLGTLLQAPSWDWLNYALDMAEPNELGRDEWRLIYWAAMQAGWSLDTSPDHVKLKSLLDSWCVRYTARDGNDQRENDALWKAGITQGTDAGWRHLERLLPQSHQQNLQGWRAFNGIDRTGIVPNAAPVQSRNIEDILNDAAKLTPDNADGAAALCREAGTLSPIHRETVLNAIRQATNIRIATLRAEASQAVNDTEPDHLAIARMTLATIGAENAIHAENHFWLWEGRGVWNKRDDIAIKKHVQATLEANGCTVTAARVSGVTDVLRNEIYRPDHTFNIGNPDVVNCVNGELELGGGGWALQPHRREHYRTTQIPVAYDPHATAPLFLAFLNDVFRDDPDRDHKIWSLLELIGYTLMSHAKHERFIMLIGGGANGKSVLLSVIEALAGMKNVAGVQPAKFNDRFQRAHLYQKLANIVTELKQGEIIADAELKAITSGELTTVEFKHTNPFDMRAFATCWFGTNHLPHTRDFSDALFRRATIITFNRTFSEAEQDHNLKAKLTAELPGILNLALNCYTHATVNGFTAPPSSIEAKWKWRKEADQVAQFVDDQCVVDPLGMVAVSEIYRHFKVWALQSGVRHVVGIQAMGDRLEMLRFPRKRSDGTWITGLRLKAVNYGTAQ